MNSSSSRFNQITGNRWFAVSLLVAAGLLLALVAMTFEDDAAPLPELHEKPEPADRVVPIGRIEQLSSNLAKAPILPLVNGRHPFFTLYFKPPPAPPAPPIAVTPDPEPAPEPTPPAPPAPVIEQVVLLYQGVYRTADGRNQAFVKTEQKLFVLPLGGSVLNDWAIAEIAPQKLTLTNRSAETTILEFNREKTLEVLKQ